MTLYSCPTKSRRQIDKRVVVCLVSEKDSGVKYTHLSSGGAGFSFQKGPTDAIGTFQLTLVNVASNSAYRIELQSTGALVNSSSDTGTSTTVGPITLALYAPGAAGNDLRIKVRKGSAAPLYKPYETLVTAAAGSQSVYIAQIPD